MKHPLFLNNSVKVRQIIPSLGAVRNKIRLKYLYNIQHPLFFNNSVKVGQILPSLGAARNKIQFKKFNMIKHLLAKAFI